MTARGGPRRLAAVLVAALLALALTPPPVRADAPGTRLFAVTVTHIECVDDCDEVGLEGLFEGHADFFVKVFINGEEHRTPTRDDSPDIDPFWTVSAQVPDTLDDVPVTLQVWDEDAAPGGDDLGDSSSHDDDNNLDFTVSYATGKWRDPATPSGDRINWPQSCSTGDGEDGSENDGPRVKVCWEISTLSASGDEDGDGLLDGWERNGYNDDDDTEVDVDLPAMGADPRHKDLFLEIDSQPGHFPSRATLQAVKNAFAFAPDNAGTRATEHGGAGNARPNPDGKPGITLHVDTGAPLDPKASEGPLIGDCADGKDNEHTPVSPDGDGRIDGLDGQCNKGEPLDVSFEEPALDCRDGQDNDNDRLPDAKDPDCHAGEDLGGGQILSGSPDTCELGRNFFDSKKVNFERSRRWIFRYAQSVAFTTDDEPAGKDCAPKDGHGEVGGNDFVVFTPDAETILHELGHTLNLRHGGPDEGNCKPNYVSAMNYNYGSHGINRVGGGYIVDFSPPRITPQGFVRGVAPLPDLVENHLTEPTVLDATDPVNEFVFTAKGGGRTPSPLNEPADWDGDGDPASGRPIDPVNLDTIGSASRPTDCTNDTTDSTLHGAEDWPFISLPFRDFGNSANARSTWSRTRRRRWPCGPPWPRR
ncbi:hypothetical protein [Kitasatospora sp. KL5]|uniref:hypothetical protein n=1 Tax=Kitasatospora sp. KL5 TaxID=3425125 RepID=UPI003D6E5F5F